jgi:hypothetical protein
MVEVSSLLSFPPKSESQRLGSKPVLELKGMALPAAPSALLDAPVEEVMVRAAEAAEVVEANALMMSCLRLRVAFEEVKRTRAPRRSGGST